MQFEKYTTKEKTNHRNNDDDNDNLSVNDQ